MRGDIARVQEKKSKSEKKFWLLSIDGKNYGIWDKSLVDDLKQGDTIESCWIENRGYRVITSLRKTSIKDDQIIRMGCLSSASRLVSATGINPQKRKKLALEMAKEFEEYVKKG